MAHPKGEAKPVSLRVGFDRRLKLEFHGRQISSDGGLLAYRELDEALGLSRLADEALSQARQGKNTRHLLTGLLRQSVYSRLAGYEDVNDAERLCRDPVMRAIVERRGLDGGAASSSQIGRFETVWLARDDNLAALTDLSGAWIDRAQSGSRTIVLDIDSSVSPTHGEQEGSRYNGHFGCTCYHPLFVFNQFGDLERSALRPRHVHSTEGWRDLLEPVVARYRDRAGRRYFRADAAFASPEVYEYLEAEGYLYAIRPPGNQVLQRRISPLLRRPLGRPPKSVRRIFYSFDDQAGSWNRARRVVAFYNRRSSGAVDQRRQAGDQVDAAVVPEVPGQRGSASASCAGLQSGQRHAHAGSAGEGCPLVADDAAGEADQDRRAHGAPRPLHHVPACGGCRSAPSVRADPVADHPPASATAADVRLRWDRGVRRAREECALPSRTPPHRGPERSLTPV